MELSTGHQPRIFIPDTRTCRYVDDRGRCGHLSVELCVIDGSPEHGYRLATPSGTIQRFTALASGC